MVILQLLEYLISGYVFYFQKIYDHGWLEGKVYVLSALGEIQSGYDDSYHAAGHVKQGTSAVTGLGRSRHLKEAGIIPRSAQGRNMSQRTVTVGGQET